MVRHQPWLDDSVTIPVTAVPARTPATPAQPAPPVLPAVPEPEAP